MRYHATIRNNGFCVDANVTISANSIAEAREKLEKYAIVKSLHLAEIQQDPTCMVPCNTAATIAWCEAYEIQYEVIMTCGNFPQIEYVNVFMPNNAIVVRQNPPWCYWANNPKMMDKIVFDEEHKKTLGEYYSRLSDEPEEFQLFYLSLVIVANAKFGSHGFNGMLPDGRSIYVHNTEVFIGRHGALASFGGSDFVILIGVGEFEYLTLSDKERLSSLCSFNS